jgi:hypothetical protein
MDVAGLVLGSNDGRTIVFRPLTLGALAELPPELERSASASDRLTYMGSMLPGAHLVASALARTAGLREFAPRLVALQPSRGIPDEFTGTPGLIEALPLDLISANSGSSDTVGYLGGQDMVEAMAKDPNTRVEASEWIRARLFDLLVGNWDHYLTQWAFVREPGARRWTPIVQDRDQAFSVYKGFVVRVERLTKPRFGKFGAEYEPIENTTWIGRHVDRRFAIEADRSTVLAVAEDLQARLTAEAIDSAVAMLPSPYLENVGSELRLALRSRCDELPRVALEFYAMLAEQVELRGTAQADLAIIERFANGDVSVRLCAASAAARPSSYEHEDTYFSRRFLRGETKEVYLYLDSGFDKVVLLGPSLSGVTVRVVGGPDGGTVERPDSGRSWSLDPDTEGKPGDGVQIAPGVWLPPSAALGPQEVTERDWGSHSYWMPRIAIKGDYGLLLGANYVHERYGFRRTPYRVRHRIGGVLNTLRARFRIDYDGEWRPENRRHAFHVGAKTSGIDRLNFFGFGNETQRTAPDDFYKVSMWTHSIEGLWRLALTRKSGLSTGGAVSKWSGHGSIFDIALQVRNTTTDLDNQETLIAQGQPYGVEPTFQVGARAVFSYNDRTHRQRGSSATHPADYYRHDVPPPVGPGVHLRVEGIYYPKLLDLISTYSILRASLGGYIFFSKRGPVLAVRTGGQKNFGEYPYYDAAYIGGLKVRGLKANRYAGDASLWANTELRFKLIELTRPVPGILGVSVIADVGRVFLEGEESEVWHAGFGGGVWWSPWNEALVPNLSVVRGTEETNVYFTLRFPF